MTIVEVFADITCPFTHVGLRRVVSEVHPKTEIIVRAWPLEWVNGAPLDALAVEPKIDALRNQLHLDVFSGFSRDHWPLTTVPALNLVASAYERGAALGLEVSLEVRDALFERGQDISDLALLTELALANGLPVPEAAASAQVHSDYTEGRRREVQGSPDFWLKGEEFFCPTLELGHDPEGNLTASFDMNGLERFISRLKTAEETAGKF